MLETMGQRQMTSENVKELIDDRNKVYHTSTAADIDFRNYRQIQRRGPAQKECVHVI
jgi:hypothetical protein